MTYLLTCVYFLQDSVFHKTGRMHEMKHYMFRFIMSAVLFFDQHIFLLQLRRQSPSRYHTMNICSALEVIHTHRTQCTYVYTT